MGADPENYTNETAETRVSDSSPQPVEEQCHGSFFSGVT